MCAWGRRGGQAAARRDGPGVLRGGRKGDRSIVVDKPVYQELHLFPHAVHRQLGSPSARMETAHCCARKGGCERWWILRIGERLESGHQATGLVPRGTLTHSLQRGCGANASSDGEMVGRTRHLRESCSLAEPMIHRRRLCILSGVAADTDRPTFERAGQTPRPWVQDPSARKCLARGVPANFSCIAREKTSIALRGEWFTTSFWHSPAALRVTVTTT